jgi:hypothetical protein
VRKVIVIDENRFASATLVAIYAEGDMIGIGEVGRLRGGGGLVCGAAFEALAASTSIAVEAMARVRF